MATTVRVDDTLHAKLREIADEEHRSIGQVIEDAIEEYRRAKFWQGAYEDYARLKADPMAWQDYQNEIALWDSLTDDGLVGEEPYYTLEDEAAIDGA